MRFNRSSRRPLVARLATAVVIASTLAMPAWSAELVSPKAPSPLRLALNSAWQQHPSFRATEAQLAAASARLQAAGQPLYNPEIEFTRDDDGPEKTTTAGLNLTLDLSGKRRARRDVASARVDQAGAEASIRRRDFVRRWVTSWADLQAAQQRVAIGERRLGLVTRFAGLADKQFAADDISGLERDLALLARDEAQADQSQLVLERADAEARFRAVGGSPGEVSAIEFPAQGVTPAATDLPSLQSMPDWKLAQSAATIAEREVLVAKRNRTADPTVGAYSGRKTYDIGGPTDNVYGVTVSVPLFVRNSYRAEVTAAQADADIAQADLQRVEIELEADWRRAVESYASAYTAWSSWRGSRGTDVGRRADLLERLWREGELSTSDYLMQLNQTLDTQLAVAELQARVWRSYTDYLAATGQLENWAGMESAR